MKKKVLTIVLAVVCVCSVFVGAFAASNSQSISALLSFGTQIKYNGVIQTFKDAAGSTVYPIMYKGTTYLPVRAICGLAGIAVDWDATTGTVLLDSKEEYKNGSLAKPSSKTNVFNSNNGSLLYETCGSFYDSLLKRQTIVESFSIIDIEPLAYSDDLCVTYEIIGVVNDGNSLSLDLKCYDAEGFLIKSTLIYDSVSKGEKFKIKDTVYIPKKTTSVKLAND